MNKFYIIIIVLCLGFTKLYSQVNLLPTGSWSVLSKIPDLPGSLPFSKAIDNDTVSLDMWHSAGTPLPHNLIISLGGEVTATQLRYYPRLNRNGRIFRYDFLSSMDGTNWTRIDSGTWSYAGCIDKDAIGGIFYDVTAMNNDIAPRLINFPATKMKYFKLITNSSIYNTPAYHLETRVGYNSFTTIRELGLVGSYNAIKWVHPGISADVTDIKVGSIVTYVDTSKFTGLKKPYIRKWTFEGGTPATSSDTIVTVTYNKIGSFSTKLSFGDATYADSLSEFGLINVHPVADSLDKGGWGVETDSELGAHPARDCLDGSNDTYWNTDVNANVPVTFQPHHILVSTYDEIKFSAFRYVPSSSWNGRVTEYELYILKDTVGVKWDDPKYLVAKGSWNGDTKAKPVAINDVAGKFFVFKTLKDISYIGTGQTSVAEIDFFGKVIAGAGVDNIAKQNFSIYPNPSAGSFNISSNCDKYKYQLLDICGKTILSGEASLNTQITAPQCAPGIYYLNINSDNSTRTEKIIIN